MAEFLANIVAATVTEAQVTVLLDPEQSLSQLEYWMQIVGVEMDWIEIVRVPVESIWVRDFGPLVTRRRDGKREVVDFEYINDRAGDRVPGLLTDKLWPDWQLRPVSLPLDGGNIQSDGQGRCITTAGYPGSGDLDARALRRQLRAKLGCTELFILPPLAGEPTGHVDMFATITGSGEVIVGAFDYDVDPVNAERLDRTATILRRGGFRVRRVPMPEASEGIFRSYTNAVAVNQTVLVPIYPEDSRNQKEVLAIFGAAYPGRKIVPHRRQRRHTALWGDSLRYDDDRHRQADARD